MEQSDRQKQNQSERSAELRGVTRIGMIRCLGRHHRPQAGLKQKEWIG